LPKLSYINEFQPFIADVIKNTILLLVHLY